MIGRRAPAMRQRPDHNATAASRIVYIYNAVCVVISSVCAKALNPYTKRNNILLLRYIYNIDVSFVVVDGGGGGN